MPTVNTKSQNQASAPASTEAILLEQIGTTEAVKSQNKFVIATDSVDPDPDPLPDIDD